jgi:hypothetical protein
MQDRSRKAAEMESLITRGRNVGTALWVREIKTRHVLGENQLGKHKKKNLAGGK